MLWALLALGLSGMNVNESIIALIVSVIALCSLALTQNFVLSFISVLAISGSCLILISSQNLYDLVHIYISANTLILAYIFLNEARIISSRGKMSKLYNPIRAGLIVSLLFGLVSIGKRHLIPISQNHIWISSIVMIFVIMYLVYTIINIIEIETIKSKLLIYSLSAIILIATLWCPSISGAIVILLLSFLVNYKTGLALGIVSLIYFISQYYYDLNFTLLVKSMILVVSGIILLLFFLFTTKMIRANEKV